MVKSAKVKRQSRCRAREEDNTAPYLLGGFLAALKFRSCNATVLFLLVEMNYQRQAPPANNVPGFLYAKRSAAFEHS